MSDGMGREFTYLSSHATNRYFIPNWGIGITKNRQALVTSWPGLVCFSASWLINKKKASP